MQNHIFNVSNGRFFNRATARRLEMRFNELVTQLTLFGGTHRWGFSVSNVLNEFTKKIQ